MAEITRQKLVTALLGKAIERGLLADEDPASGMLRVRYPESQSAGADSLHKQAVRNLGKRLAPDWKTEVASLGLDTGFDVRLWPPSKAATEPKTEASSDPVLAAIEALTAEVRALRADLTGKG